MPTEEDDMQTSDCCDAALEYAGGAQCSDCGRGVPTDDLLDRAAERAPGDVHDLSVASADPIERTVTDRTYRSAVHALDHYLRCRASGASAMDLSPMPSASVSAEAAYARDVHEARELERLFREARSRVLDRLRKGRRQWKLWCKVRVGGQPLREAGPPRSTVNDAINDVDEWIELTLDDWSKLDGGRPDPTGHAGDAASAAKKRGGSIREHDPIDGLEV